MPDEIKPGAAEKEPTVITEPAKKDEIDIEAIRAENERLKKENELKANELKTRDKKITEFQREINSTKTAEEKKRLKLKKDARRELQDIVNLQ